MALTVQYIGGRPVVYLGNGASRNPTAGELKMIQSNPNSVTVVDRSGRPLSLSAVTQQQQQMAAQQNQAARLNQMTPQQQMADLQARQRAEAEAAQRARDQAAAVAEQQRQAQLAEQRRLNQIAEAQRVAQQQAAEQQRQAAAQAEAQRLLQQQQQQAQRPNPGQPTISSPGGPNPGQPPMIVVQGGPVRIAEPTPTPPVQPATQPVYQYDTRTPFKGVNIPANLGSITPVQGGRPVWSNTPTQGGTTVQAAPGTGTSSWGKSSSTAPMMLPATAPMSAPVAPR